MTSRNFSARSGFWTGLLVSLSAFLVYLNTLCPTIFWLDSGELVTAAYGLGIPHPPGFPLWCLLAKPFSWIPVGDMAYRMNLSSAFFAAVGVGLVYVFLRESGISLWTSAMTALIGAFSYSYWRQAVVVEVYSLLFILFLVTLILGMRFLRTGRPKWFYGSLFTYALSIATHYLLLLAAPAFLIILLIARRDILKNLPLIFTGILCFLAGLSVFLYLPIRSLADPVLDWGDPETLVRFWDHVRRAQYQLIGSGVGQLALPGHLSFTGWSDMADRFMRQAAVTAEIFFMREYTWGFGLIGLAGGAVLWKRNKRFFLATLLIILACGFGFGFATNHEMDIEKRDFLPFVPGLLVFLLWVGRGLETAMAFLRSRILRFGESFSNWTIRVITAACVIFFAATRYGACDLSQHVFARQFGERILDAIEPGGIFFASNDNAYFVTLYLTAVEGLRPDIRLIGTSRLNQNVYPDQIRARYPDIRFPSAEEIKRLYKDHSIEGHPELRKPSFNLFFGRALAQANFGISPVYWNLGNEKIGSSITPLPRGYIYKLLPVREVSQEEWDEAEYASRRFWSEIDESLLHNPVFMKEKSARHSVALIRNNNGFRLLERGLEDEARREYEAAAAVFPELAQPYFNLGNYYLKQGKDTEAERYYALAVHYDEDYANAYLNLGNINLNKGDLEKAAFAYRQALRANPNLMMAYSNLATLYSRTGQVDNAIRLYKRALRIDPTQTLIHYNLGMALQKASRWSQAAMSFEFVVSRRPDFVPALVRLGQVHVLSGSSDRAVQAWERALVLDPSLDEVRLELNRLKARAKAAP